MTQTDCEPRPSPPAMGAPAVEYRDLTFRYPRPGAGGVGGVPALENITLSVPGGERLGILGPNGGGKSTLLKLTLGLLDGYSGTIRVLGLTPEQARRKRLIGYVPQRIEAELSFPLTVRQVVSLAATVGLRPWQSLTAQARAHVDECLRVVGVLELAERAIGRLSGGQLQRVMIARALACRPRILMLDEPMVGIDAVGQQQFGALLVRLHEQLKLTIIVVSHDLRTVAAGCDSVACLSRTLHSHVAPGGLTPAVLAEVFRHDVAAIFGSDLHVHAHAAGACPLEHSAKGVGAVDSGRGDPDPDPSPARRASPPLPGDRGEGGGGR